LKCIIVSNKYYIDNYIMKLTTSHYVFLIIVFILSFAYNVKINYMKDATFIEELKLYWGENCYHIHHWITFSFIIFIVILVQISPPIISYIIIAFSLGAIIEDFLFSDIFIIKEMCVN
jgi:hypothetical protein